MIYGSVIADGITPPTRAQIGCYSVCVFSGFSFLPGINKGKHPLSHYSSIKCFSC